MSHDLSEFIDAARYAEFARQVEESLGQLWPDLGWACEQHHYNPDTGREFLNDWCRDKCEICTRPRPAGGAGTSSGTSLSGKP